MKKKNLRLRKEKTSTLHKRKRAYVRPDCFTFQPEKGEEVELSAMNLDVTEDEWTEVVIDDIEGFEL